MLEKMAYLKLKMMASLCTVVAMTGCANMAQNTAVPVGQAYTLNQQCPAELHLAVGETLRFTADDNPSTGYAWKLRAPLEILEATSVYKANKTEGYLVVGAGGVRQFSFTAKNVGTETIHLVYTRSWELTQVATEWRCKVTVA